MSYYERRIAKLEARIEEMAKRERMKAIPVEAKLIDSIAELKAENKRLRSAGDVMKRTIAFSYPDSPAIKNWNSAAKEGKQS